MYKAPGFAQGKTGGMNSVCNVFDENKKSEPVPDWEQVRIFCCMVDDIGLEPMTFRTSSGCSSQLS